MKQQQKKDKILRKQNPNIDVPVVKKQHREKLQKLPSIQVMLNIPNGDRSQRAHEYHKQIKPFLHSFIQKKEGSRVTQLIYKWGGKEVQASIHQGILQHWKELIKSKYALFMIEKVLKDFEIGQIFDDMILLQNSREGAKVLQSYIEKNPESENVKKMKKKLHGINEKSKQGDMKSQQILHNIALKCIQKEYYFYSLSKIVLLYALPSMFDEEKQKTIQFMIEKVSDIIGDEDGIKLFIELVNNCTSKQKKSLVKLFKGHINQIINNNNVSYVAIIKLVTQIDDTVMVGKTLISEIVDLLPQIEKNKKLYNLVMSLLSPRNNAFNCLGKYEKNVTFTLCKKPEEQRKKQIREYLYQPLAAFLTSQQKIQNACKDMNLSRLTLGLIKSMQTDHSKGLKKVITTLCETFLKDLSENMKGKNIKMQSSMVADNFGSKLIKNVLLLQQTYVDKYCDQFCQIFNRNLQAVLKSKASFVLTILIEKGGRDQILAQIKNLKLKMADVVAGNFYIQRMK